MGKIRRKIRNYQNTCINACSLKTAKEDKEDVLDCNGMQSGLPGGKEYILEKQETTQFS